MTTTATLAAAPAPTEPSPPKADSITELGAVTAAATSTPAVRAAAAAAVPPSPTAKRRPAWLDTVNDYAGKILPPVITLALLLGIWELASSQTGAALPAPSKVISDTKDLILDPLFDNGGNDVGMAWQLLASRKRVLYGYSIAVVVGISLGVLVGQFAIAMRGLDPIFQVLRTVPPLAWLPIALAGFRDGNPSAIFVIFITAVWPIIINTSIGIRNIPNDYRNVARASSISGRS